MPRAAQFSPGVIDHDGRMSASYHSGRALSAEAASTWCATAAPFVREAGCARVLDLGSGTGRFSTLFARSFGTEVIGIEPSKGMLAAAAREERPGNLTYVVGAAENIPLRDNSCGLAWLSHVWHHIRDRHACARELRRVLGRESKVLLRGTFGDTLDGFPTLFRYWPATRGICQQLPTIRELFLKRTALSSPNIGEFSRRPAAVFASSPSGRNCALILLLPLFRIRSFARGSPRLSRPLFTTVVPCRLSKSSSFWFFRVPPNPRSQLAALGAIVKRRG